MNCVDKIENTIDSYIDINGKFNSNKFSKQFLNFRKELLREFPDTKNYLKDNFIYADKKLTYLFIEILDEPVPTSDAYSDLAHMIEKIGAYIPPTRVRQFSKEYPDKFGLPPKNIDVIVYRPDFYHYVPARLVDELMMGDLVVGLFINKSVGGNFALLERDCRYYVPNTYNIPRTTDNAVVSNQLADIQSNSDQVARLIKIYKRGC